jgi:hypothetical protein
MLPPATNAAARQAGLRTGQGLVGGSDAHTLATVGRAWTEVRGARDREEFLAGLRRRATLPAGRSGTWGRMTADILRVVGAGLTDAWAGRTPPPAGAPLLLLAALPLATLVPLATLLQMARERLAAVALPRALAAALQGAVPAVAVEP